MPIGSFSPREAVRFAYRTRFLIYLDEIAPEVAQDIGNLLPLRDEIFKVKDCRNVLSTWFFGTDNPFGAIGNLPLFTRKYWNGDRSSMANSDVKEVLGKLHGLLDEYTEIMNEKYCLSEPWLLNDVFRFFLIYDKSRNGRAFDMGMVAELPLLNPNEYPKYPDQFAADGTPVIPLTGVHRLPIGLQYITPVGDPPIFITPRWQMQFSETEYRKMATELFQMQLENYIAETRKKWDGLEYKLKTGTKLKFARVKLLVLWTVKGMSKPEILALIDRENETLDKPYDAKSLDKLLRDMKAFGLPVRKVRKRNSS